MLLYNEKYQQLDADKIKIDLLNSLNDTPAPKSEQEVEELLGDYYQQAHQLDMKQYDLASPSLVSSKTAAFSLSGIGRTVLSKIRKFVCSILNAGSTTQDIIDAVLKAISSIIPGGIIIEMIVKKIVSYIVSIGVSKFCPVAPSSK